VFSAHVTPSLRVIYGAGDGLALHISPLHAVMCAARWIAAAPNTWQLFSVYDMARDIPHLPAGIVLAAQFAKYNRLSILPCHGLDHAQLLVNTPYNVAASYRLLEQLQSKRSLFSVRKQDDLDAVLLGALRYLCERFPQLVDPKARASAADLQRVFDAMLALLWPLHSGDPDTFVVQLRDDDALCHAKAAVNEAIGVLVRLYENCNRVLLNDAATAEYVLGVLAYCAECVRCTLFGVPAPRAFEQCIEASMPSVGDDGGAADSCATAENTRYYVLESVYRHCNALGVNEPRRAYIALGEVFDPLDDSDPQMLAQSNYGDFADKHQLFAYKLSVKPIATSNWVAQRFCYQRQSNGGGVTAIQDSVTLQHCIRASIECIFTQYRRSLGAPGGAAAVADATDLGRPVLRVPERSGPFYCPFDTRVKLDNVPFARCMPFAVHGNWLTTVDGAVLALLWNTTLRHQMALLPLRNLAKRDANDGTATSNLLLLYPLVSRELLLYHAKKLAPCCAVQQKSRRAVVCDALRSFIRLPDQEDGCDAKAALHTRFDDDDDAAHLYCTVLTGVFHRVRSEADRTKYLCDPALLQRALYAMLTRPSAEALTHFHALPVSLLRRVHTALAERVRTLFSMSPEHMVERRTLRTTLELYGIADEDLAYAEGILTSVLFEHEQEGYTNADDVVDGVPQLLPLLGRTNEIRKQIFVDERRRARAGRAGAAAAARKRNGQGEEVLRLDDDDEDDNNNNDVDESHSSSVNVNGNHKSDKLAAGHRGRAFYQADIRITNVLYRLLALPCRSVFGDDNDDAVLLAPIVDPQLMLEVFFAMHSVTLSIGKAASFRLTRFTVSRSSLPPVQRMAVTSTSEETALKFYYDADYARALSPLVRRYYPASVDALAATTLLGRGTAGEVLHWSRNAMCALRTLECNARRMCERYGKNKHDCVPSAELLVEFDCVTNALYTGTLASPLRTIDRASDEYNASSPERADFMEYMLPLLFNESDLRAKEVSHRALVKQQRAHLFHSIYLQHIAMRDLRRGTVRIDDAEAEAAAAAADSAFDQDCRRMDEDVDDAAADDDDDDDDYSADMSVPAPIEQAPQPVHIVNNNANNTLPDQDAMDNVHYAVYNVLHGRVYSA
jgi:hypothetical protein